MKNFTLCLGSAPKHMSETYKSMLFKNYWGSIESWWTCAYLSGMFVKAQYLQIVFTATLFSKKKSFL